MNIHEAITGDKPFTNSDMIGAWLFVDGYLVHRDNVSDFNDMDWIRDNCLLGAPFGDIMWFKVNDLLRTDWEFVE